MRLESVSADPKGFQRQRINSQIAFATPFSVICCRDEVGTLTDRRYSVCHGYPETCCFE